MQDLKDHYLHLISTNISLFLFWGYFKKAGGETGESDVIFWYNAGNRGPLEWDQTVNRFLIWPQTSMKIKEWAAATGVIFRRKSTSSGIIHQPCSFYDGTLEKRLLSQECLCVFVMPQQLKDADRGKSKVRPDCLCVTNDAFLSHTQRPVAFCWVNHRIVIRLLWTSVVQMKTESGEEQQRRLVLTGNRACLSNLSNTLWSLSKGQHVCTERRRHMTYTLLDQL